VLAEVYSVAEREFTVRLGALPATADAPAGVRVHISYADCCDDGLEFVDLRGGVLTMGSGGGPNSHILSATLAVDGDRPQHVTATVARYSNRVSVWWEGGQGAAEPISLDIRCPESTVPVGGTSAAGGGEISAPMPGKIVRVVVEEGQEVEAGQPLLIMVCTFPVNPSYAQ
jgi:hypothetical protein